MARCFARGEKGDGARGEDVGVLAGVGRLEGVLGEVEEGDSGGGQGAEEREDAVAGGEVPEAVAKDRGVVGWGRRVVRRRLQQGRGVGWEEGDAGAERGVRDVLLGLTERERGAVVWGRVVNACYVARGA